VIEVATGRLDGDVVGRQPDVGVGATVVLLDVRLEVVKVGDRSETGHQRGEGSDGHVVSVASDLGGTLVLCGGHDLGPMLAILVRDRSLRVAVIRLVLGRHLFSTSWQSRSSRTMMRWTAPEGPYSRS
jgi:hypothetical protein